MKNDYIAAYKRTVDIQRALRQTMDNNKMKSAQIFVMADRDKSVICLHIVSLTAKSKEKLCALIAQDFCESLELLKETDSTMDFASYIGNQSKADRIRYKATHKTRDIKEKDIVKAANEMPIEILEMLVNQFNWHFDINNGAITSAVVEV